MLIFFIECIMSGFVGGWLNDMCYDLIYDLFVLLGFGCGK